MLGGTRMAAAPASDCPCTIIGAGRIGTALADMGKAAGFHDTIVKRGEPIPADGTGPIYVTVRNDDLKGVIDACPANRKGDLVFYGQNGYIEKFLEEQQLSGSAASQVLVYMAVAKLGEKPTDGITDLNPEGLTSATGKWAGQVASRLKGADLTCGVFDAAPFRARMFEKHMWICAFMLLGVTHSGTVGDVESKHKDELVKMVTEMMSAISEETGVEFEAGCPERLLAYARSVAHFPTALKEFDWRNKYFLDLTRARAAKGLPDLTPMHTDLLSEPSTPKPEPETHNP